MIPDLGAALRSLRRAPAFTGLVVLTLALGIGVTTAMFSVVDAVLLNPLPFPTADRLSEIWTVTAPAGSRRPGGSTAVIQALRRQPELFTAVEAYQFGSANVTGDGDPEIVTAPRLSPGLLSALGPTPLVGRLFTQEDAALGDVVLLAERFWVRRYGSDPAIVGREIMVDDRRHRVVGVVPRSFRFPEGSIELWRPIDLSASAKPRRVQVVAVRRADVTPAQLNARLAALSPSLRDSAAIAKTDSLTTDLLLQQRFARQSGQALYTMFGAVALVLLVACVNVTNLLLVRSSTRHGELALMTALGASRGTLVRAVLVEGVILASAGCLFGLLLARTLLRVILDLAPPRLTFLTAATTDLDWRALTFAAALASATCLVFGLLPAWRTARVDAIDALKRRAQGVIGSHDDWWQGVLVAGQLALVLVLLAGSGVLLRSFTRLVEVDSGFDVNRLSVVDLQLQSDRYGGPGVALAFVRDLARTLGAAGIKATISGGAPPTPGTLSFELEPEVEGGVPGNFAGITLPSAEVAPDYFATMGIPILQGRAFEAGDSSDAVIINDVLAKRFWGDTSAVGRRFRLDPKGAWFTVVGVAADVKVAGPRDSMGEGMEFYQPFSPTERYNFFSLIIRSAGNQTADLQVAKQRLWEMDARQPIVQASSMEERIGESIAGPRFFLTLASAFAVTAALLAAVGVYGVSAYWVSRRRRELAIRVALGASRDQVMSMVFRRSLRLATIGCAVGLGLTLLGAQAIESLLFQTSARDPLIFLAVTAVLGAVALLASSLPALKASRVDPMTVLRAE